MIMTECHLIRLGFPQDNGRTEPRPVHTEHRRGQYEQEKDAMVTPSNAIINPGAVTARGRGRERLYSKFQYIAGYEPAQIAKAAVSFVVAAPSFSCSFEERRSDAGHKKRTDQSGRRSAHRASSAWSAPASTGGMSSIPSCEKSCRLEGRSVIMYHRSDEIVLELSNVYIEE